MSEPIEIFWKDCLVGTLVNSVPYMWYLEGEFVSSSSEIAEDFQKLAEKLDPKWVLKNWDNGIVIKLKASPTSSFFGVVHSLSESSLFLRRITAKENIEWVSKRYSLGK